MMSSEHLVSHGLTTLGQPTSWESMFCGTFMLCPALLGLEAMND